MNMYREPEPEESVYHLIPPPDIKPPKQPLYVSKHSKFLPGTQEKRRAAATFGKLDNKASPTQYLKKYERTAPLSKDQRKFERAGGRKPEVPSRDDAPVMGLVSSKNYITANAVDNILAVPKRVESKQVNYLAKPDYGKVPQYLGRVKAQVEEEYEMIRAMQEVPDETSSQLQMLSEQERQGILEGLKANWERINTEYQTLSFSVDTASKKKRKEEYEAMLEQIERDVKKLQKGFVFVANDGLM